MKKERITCKSARLMCIVQILAKFGHFPTKSTEKEAWFLSPLRSETQASFKVSKKLNRWYDHGIGKGGNSIDLVVALLNCSVKEALEYLNDNDISFSFQPPQVFKAPIKETIQIIQTMEITHFGLKEYLKSRNIKFKTASRLCKEVHYRVKGKTYFAIGLQNESGGWELRNKYFKSSSAPKDITHIKNGNNKLIITEGMFDTLTLIDENIASGEYDFLILNSTAFIQKAKNIIDDYKIIDLYLDNDTTGKQITKELMDGSEKCIDKSFLYKDHKDINEWKVEKANYFFEQVIQDVSLLPQRRSCFTPEGRKVNKK